jgi:hypothetical protein
MVGPRAVGILYALSAPPDAPVPRGMELRSHTSETHGVDVYVYGSRQMNVCDIVAFYQQQNGECLVEAGWCGASDVNYTELYIEPVAVCEGLTDFSIFTMAWEADIRAGDRGEQYVEVNLARRIFWTGAGSGENR